MLEHYFISDTDGALHDTRMANWSSRPIRTNYKLHHRSIDSVADLKATLRAGAYAWPGGYPLFFITSDGAALSFDSARENLPQVIWSIANGVNDGWRVVACDINYEDGDLTCDHSGKQIESAYAD